MSPTPPEAPRAGTGADTPGRSDVTAIIVNYDSGDRLARLLERLEDEVRQIVVVDNASSDGSARAARDRPGVVFLANPSNAGFATAANLGVELATGAWLLFANPDTHPEHGVIGSLISHVPDDVAVVAPIQVGSDDEPLTETGGHDPSLARYLAWAILPARLRADRGPWLAPPLPLADCFPDWVSGAFMAVRADAFERVHGFDERFFLYQEDADLCRRLRTSGYRVMCRAWLRVRHEVMQGDASRRAAAAARSVEPLSDRFTGWRRRGLGLVLSLGYGLRSPLPRQGRAARAALPASLRLLRSG